MNSYEGVVIANPASVPYVRHTKLGASWFIGTVFKSLLHQSGLKKEEVDGIAMSSFSLTPDAAISLTQHFRVSPRWIDQINLGGASGLVALRRAARAVQAGDAEVIACLSGDTASKTSFLSTAANFSSWTVDAAFPYGAAGPNAVFSLITQNYMDCYGATREDFARICLDQRYNSTHCHRALLGGAELTMEDYLNARHIAGPLHLFDCVMPCAGGEGFLVMTESRAKALPVRYARIMAADELHNAHKDDPIQFRGGWTEYAQQLYDMAGVGPSEIDCVQTYDDYPVISMIQMEDLLLCHKGDAPRFVQDTDMRFDGSGKAKKKLPHNTSGGQLSCGQAGTAAGYLGVTEALRQVTNAAGSNQVADARTCLISGYGMVNYDRGLCSAAAILASGN